MSGRFEGKVVLVAGGGWDGPEGHAIGMGAAISQHFASEGAKVAVMDFKQENADRTVAPILTAGGEAFAILGDMSVDVDCQRAIDETVAKYGALDILVNNAALMRLPEGVEHDSLEAMDIMNANNYRSFMVLGRLASEHIPPGGSVIHIGSTFGGTDPIAGSYSISKRAVAFVAVPIMAQELAPFGIRVNGVNLGYVWNAETQRLLPGLKDGQSVDEWRQERADQLTALRIEGDGWDAAKATAFLASDDARWITGVDLVVDGGYHLIAVFDVLFGRRDPQRRFGRVVEKKAAKKNS